jgi:hypothetical protein
VVRRITLTQDFYINNLAVIFGDFFIFKLWDFEHTPALVIGMDMIGTLNTFGVDYLRSEVQVRLCGTGPRVGEHVRRVDRQQAAENNRNETARRADRGVGLTAHHS